MPDSSIIARDFQSQLAGIIGKNIANEQFGVSELAEAMNMSRSNLLRKVKKETNLSVSQLISQARLKKGMELLREGSLNVSEVSHRVGFSSTSYFIKCFREYYGFPPGEVGKRANEPEPVPIAPPPTNGKMKFLIGTTIAVLVLVALGWISYSQWRLGTKPDVEKSIAVLPFKNDSNDSSNVYLINGLMESTLNNLQKIKDLRVISRTSSEKYRTNAKTTPEIAKELNVTYLVEGSGQKIGDRIVLNIQLVDGKSDRHLWSRQYRRQAEDIFAMQQEISKDIVEEIQAVITPDEKTRIEKVPTQNAEAYDSFLKGLDLLNIGGHDNLEKSIPFFQEATSMDKSFALAYACAAMSCYYLDQFQEEKKHLDDLGNFADNALLYDPGLGEALTAKAMHYLLKKEYNQALPYLEKGLEYHPNSGQIIQLLGDFYAHKMPNTGKYLEYALKGLRLDASPGDSVAVSYFHLQLANALIQSGFVDESLKHLDISLEYFSKNAFARYIRAFVLYAKNGDLKVTRRLLVAEFKKDTNRFDILQDIGKVSYYLGEYDTAYQCYERFNRFRKSQKLDVYAHENFLIGTVYEKVGETEKAKEFYESYRKYMYTNQTAYRHLGFVAYYCRTGESEKALEHLRLFAKEDNIQYWIILFLDKDPEPTETERQPEFKALMEEIERKFWANHEKLKLKLEEQGLL